MKLPEEKDWRDILRLLTLAVAFNLFVTASSTSWYLLLVYYADVIFLGAYCRPLIKSVVFDSLTKCNSDQSDFKIYNDLP